MNPTFRRSSIFFACVLLLGAAGCQRIDSSLTGDIETLALDEPVTGEMTSANPLNYSDGTRSVAFRFSMEPGQAVDIEAEASFCGRLTLYALDPDGRQVLQGPVTASECSEKAGRLVQVRSNISPSGGRYLLAFSGEEPADFGPYRVSMSLLRIDDDRDLVAGDDVTGQMDDGKNLALKVTEAGRYQIDLRSAEFDPTLKLEGEGASYENDDKGDGTDSRLTVYLQPGDYRLELGRVGSSGGLYRLAVVKKDDGVPAGVELQNGGELAAGGSVTGMLQGAPVSYQLVLTERGRVELALQSDDFDSRLNLEGEGVKMSDDDGGEGTGSRLITLLDPGSYTVSAADLEQGSSGLFTLSAKVQPTRDGVPYLVPGLEQSGSLVRGEQRRYRLSVPATADYELTMRSSDIDSVLNLVRGGEVINTDDDGGNDSDARIGVELEPGEYQVIATALGGSTGSFRIKAAIR